MFNANAEHLTDASAGVVEEKDQRVITSPDCRGAIRLREKVLYVLRFEVLRGADLSALARQREYPLILSCPLQVMLYEVSEEAADRGQADITASGGVGSGGLKMR